MPSQEKDLPSHHLFQHYFRLLICLAATGSLVAQSAFSNSPLACTVIIALAVSYLALSHILPRTINSQFRGTTERALEQIDTALVGVVMVLIDFSPLPSALLLSMVQFNGLLGGGTGKLIRDNFSLLVGALLTILYHQPQWSWSTSLPVSVVTLISIISYFCLAAYYLASLLKKARKISDENRQQEELYRNRTYKLSRYLPRAVWQAVKEGQEKKLVTERKLMTIFFSDIKEFSQLSEELEAETLTGVLNTYLTEMSKIITHHGGTLDKFMGDGMMVFFGDHDTKGARQDAYRCLSMALAMRKKMKELQQVWHNQGIKRPLQIRMGINTGFCTVGTFGTSHHLDYTALGTHVNLASRLESAAKPGEILISYETWSLVKDVVMCRDKGEITVKGFSHPIKVYEVVNFRKELGSQQSYFEHDAEGFSLHLDLERIRNYDKARVLRALEEVHRALEEKVIV